MVALKKIMAARPKTGRKTFSYTVALTPEQIEFLNSFPNASETVRKLLNGIMEVWYDIEAKFPVLVLKHQIDVLGQQLTKLGNERSYYQQAHDKEMNEYTRHYDKSVSEDYVWVEAKELHTPEAEYHRNIIKNMDEATAAIKAKIQELRDRVMAVTALDELKDKIETI